MYLFFPAILFPFTTPTYNIMASSHEADVSNRTRMIALSTPKHTPPVRIRFEVRKLLLYTNNLCDRKYFILTLHVTSLDLIHKSCCLWSDGVLKRAVSQCVGTEQRVRSRAEERRVLLEEIGFVASVVRQGLHGVVFSSRVETSSIGRKGTSGLRP
jgi:hypothetical protein